MTLMLDLATYERIYRAAEAETKEASSHRHGKGSDNRLFNAIFERMVAEELEKRNERKNRNG